MEVCFVFVCLPGVLAIVADWVRRLYDVYARVANGEP